MRIEKYDLELNAETVRFSLSRVNRSVRRFSEPDRLVVTINEHHPAVDEKTLLKIKILKFMLEKLMGRKFDLRLPPPAYSVSIAYEKGRQFEDFELEEENFSFEYADFQAHGSVKTKDGREIEFSLRLVELSAEYSYARVTGRTVDPIVLELGSRATGAERKKVLEVDLDFDGRTERLLLQPWEGLLVYDLNGNGRVDGAYELFGPVTGDALMELGKLDSDGDGWIDEDDKEFFRIKIWTTDENGRQKLVGLLDLNVGAIFLGSVSTPFETYSRIVRRSGIFLREDGTVGTLRQLDFKV